MLRQEFAVVLLDVLMPGMDGFETAANIKRLDQTKDVPIILLTGAEADSDYAYRGYSVGIADFLIKPFDPWLLRTKVSVFLDLHRQKRQISAQAEQLRRLLVTESHSTAHAQPGGSVEPADRMRDKQQRRTTGAGPALARGRNWLKSPNNSPRSNCCCATRKVPNRADSPTVSPTSNTPSAACWRPGTPTDIATLTDIAVRSVAVRPCADSGIFGSAPAHHDRPGQPRPRCAPLSR